MSVIKRSIVPIGFGMALFVVWLAGGTPTLAGTTKDCMEACKANWFEVVGQKYGPWFPILTAAATILVLIASTHVAISATRLTERIAQRSEEMSKLSLAGTTLLSCNERFDQIAQLLWEAQYAGSSENNVTQPQARGLYRRYWGLQHDQWQYFSDGLIPENNFRYWLHARYMDYNRRDAVDIAGISYKKAWEDLKENFSVPGDDFYDVMSIAMNAETRPNGRQEGQGAQDCVNAALARFRQDRARQTGSQAAQPVQGQSESVQAPADGRPEGSTASGAELSAVQQGNVMAEPGRSSNKSAPLPPTDAPADSKDPVAKPLSWYDRERYHVAPIRNLHKRSF